MAKSLTKAELIAGVADVLEKRVADNYTPVDEDAATLMDMLAGDGCHTYHETYVAGGCDAVDLIRMTIDALYDEPEPPSV